MIRLKILIMMALCLNGLMNVVYSADSFFAEVKKIRGVAYVEGKELKIGDRVGAGKIISAKGKGNFIDIKLSNGAAMRIVGGEFRVSKVSNRMSVYEILMGKVFSYFKKTSNSQHIIKTKQAAFAVRGTRFLAEQQEDKSFLCVCEGSVQASNDTGKSVIVNAGSEVYISKDDKDFVNNVAIRDMSKLKGVFSDMGYPVE